MDNDEELQYVQLVKNIIENGSWENTRNGKTLGIFGYMMRYSLKDGVIPIFTTKKTAWKTCLKELIWFIRGNTDNKILKDQGVHIWDANTTREFLDSRGLHNYPEDIIGPGYGFQWRHFNARYFPENAGINPNLDISDSASSRGIDQLQQIIDALKDPSQRTSRRLIMTAWNPCQLDEMALPPCHILCQFNVHDGNKLSCALYQRSNDVSLGTSFNVTSYSFLTHLIAKHCGLEAHEFIHFMGNCHIYENHVEPMKQLFDRKPHPFPKVNIKCIRDNIDDYEVEDFEVSGYTSHDVIKMTMVA